MTTTLKGLEFDPGFAPYVMAFTGSLDVIYYEINKFKNFSQKKMKFMQFHKKILEVFNNNLGFYVGCLMWAAYLKTQPSQDLLSNPCLNMEYNEDENTRDVDFMLNFTNLFNKDMQYFLGQTYKFEPQIISLLEIYKEFLTINKGFIETKLTSDVVLPPKLKVDNAESFKLKIDEAIKIGDLSKLLEYLPSII